MADEADAGGMAPVPGRVCGECTACCSVFRLDELQKPAGVMCSHCSPGRGCGIYETRPQPCRTFFCMWRTVGTMPDELRPDRTGVVFSMESSASPSNPFEKLFVIGRAVNSLADFDSPGARMALQTFIVRGDVPVWLSFGQVRRLLHPHPLLRDAILGVTPTPVELEADVKLWRQRLQLPA